VAVAFEQLILMRLIQLTLGALIGCLCIYFGYKLFSQIPVNVTNDGHFKIPKFAEVKLKAAPGVCFALLGTVIVFFCINRKMDLEIKTGGTSPAKEAQAPNAPAQSSKSYTCNLGGLGLFGSGDSCTER
jgi:hypothetical protein